MLENQNDFFTFNHSSASLHCFIFVSVLGVIFFNIRDSILKFSGKNYNLALHLVEIDANPYPP
jgi:hypothetical protein